VAGQPAANGTLEARVTLYDAAFIPGSISQGAADVLIEIIMGTLRKINDEISAYP
jgi:hypothetical protein